jgi:hypothetical protein
MVPNKANLIEHLFPQRHRDSEWGCQEQMLLTKLPNGTYLVSNEKGSIWIPGRMALRIQFLSTKNRPSNCRLEINRQV